MGTTQSKAPLDEDQQLFASRLQNAIKRLPTLSDEIKEKIQALGPITRQQLKEFRVDDDELLNSTIMKGGNNNNNNNKGSTTTTISVTDQGIIRNAVEIAKLSKTKLEQRLITAIKCNDKVSFDCAVALGATGIKIGIDEELVRILDHKAKALQELEEGRQQQQQQQASSSGVVTTTTTTTTASLPKLPKHQQIVYAHGDNSAILSAIEHNRDQLLKKLLEGKSFIEPLVHSGASNKSPLQLFVERYNSTNAQSFDSELFNLLLQKSRVHTTAEELVDLQAIGFKREIIPMIRAVEKEFEMSPLLKKKRPTALFATAVVSATPSIFETLINEFGFPEKVGTSRNKQTPILEVACSNFNLHPLLGFFKNLSQEMGMPTTGDNAVTVQASITTSNGTTAEFSSANASGNNNNSNNQGMSLSNITLSTGTVVQVANTEFSSPESTVAFTKKIRTLVRHGAHITLNCLESIFSTPYPDDLNEPSFLNRLIQQQETAMSSKANAASLTDKEKKEVIEKIRQLYDGALLDRKKMLRELAAGVTDEVKLEAIKKFNLRTLRDIVKCGFVIPYLTRNSMIVSSKPASEKRAFLEQASNEARLRDPAGAERIEEEEKELREKEKSDAVEVARKNRQQQQQSAASKNNNNAKSAKSVSAADQLNIPKEFDAGDNASSNDDDDDEIAEDEEFFDDDEEEETLEEEEEGDKKKDRIANDDDDDEDGDNNDDEDEDEFGSEDEDDDDEENGGGKKKKKNGGPNSLRPEMKKMLQAVHNILIKGKDELHQDDGGKIAASAAAAASGDTTNSENHQDFEFFKKCVVLQKKVLKNNLAVTELGKICEQFSPSAKAVVLVLQQHNIGQRLLCQAAFGGYVEELSTLIEVANISPDMQFSADLGGVASRFTLLQMMVSMGATEMVRQLLDHGANPNYSVTAYDKAMGSESALSVACERGDAEVTKMLLDAGADFDFVNYNGLTPLEIAGKGRKQECVALIRQSKIDREKKRKEAAEAEKKAKREKEEARRREKEEKNKELELEKKKQREEEAAKQKAKEQEKEKKRKIREQLNEIEKKMQQVPKDDLKKRGEILEEEKKSWNDKFSKFTEKLDAIAAKEELERRSRELPCSVCGKTLPKNSFSRNQWTEKTDETRKCKLCVEAELAKEKELQQQREKEKADKAAAAAAASAAATKEKQEKQEKQEAAANTATHTISSSSSSGTLTTPSVPPSKLIRIKHKNYFWNSVTDVDATYERATSNSTLTPQKVQDHLVINFSFSEPTASQQEKHALNSGALPIAAVASAAVASASSSGPTSSAPKFYHVPLHCFLTTKGLSSFIEGTDTRPVAVCFDYCNHGECKWGERCKFGHPISAKSSNAVLHQVAKSNKKFAKYSSATFPTHWGLTQTAPVQAPPPTAASLPSLPGTTTTTNNITPVTANTKPTAATTSTTTAAAAVASSSSASSPSPASTTKQKTPTTAMEEKEKAFPIASASQSPKVPKPSSASIINDDDEVEEPSTSLSRVSTTNNTPAPLNNQSSSSRQQSNSFYPAAPAPSQQQEEFVTTTNIVTVDASVQNMHHLHASHQPHVNSTMNADADVFLPSTHQQQQNINNTNNNISSTLQPAPQLPPPQQQQQQPNPSSNSNNNNEFSSIFSSLQAGFNNNNNNNSHNTGLDFFGGGGGHSSSNINNTVNNLFGNGGGLSGFGNFVFDQPAPSSSSQQQQNSLLGTTPGGGMLLNNNNTKNSNNHNNQTLQQRVGISFSDSDDDDDKVYPNQHHHHHKNTRKNQNDDDDYDDDDDDDIQNDARVLLRGPSKKQKAAALKSSLFEARNQLEKAQLAAAQVLKALEAKKSKRHNKRNYNDDSSSSSDDDSSSSDDDEEDNLFKIESLMELDDFEEALELCKNEIEQTTQRLSKLNDLKNSIESKLAPVVGGKVKKNSSRPKKQ